MYFVMIHIYQSSGEKHFNNSTIYIYLQTVKTIFNLVVTKNQHKLIIATSRNNKDIYKSLSASKIFHTGNGIY